ncbi:MAG: DUF362 domain-containing protein [Bacteroidales bacterium]|nr:DUF362 domain-containing protein [Bacteroidales bacterium]MCL2132771.1 DUF362 domain-containing protein [Bacteroidales bacterium]
MQSKVYFTDLHTTPTMSLPAKFERLIREAGIAQLDCKDKFTAVKIHFGEPGNMAYLRHNYAARLVAVLHELGARVFLTDANTLYSGQRSNAIQHLKAAFEHGYNIISVPAPVIIADGLKGTEYRELSVNSAICATAKVGSVIADADVIVSLNHFKGHEQTGFGGALKNIGMGSASRRGKLELHSSSKPRVAEKYCVGCGQCVKDCNYAAITLNAQKRAVINFDACVGCGQCIAVCRYGAAQPVWDNASEIMNKMIAEYTLAIVKDKPHFHVSLIVDVSPECDCWGSNDVPLVPNIGMAASFDPVALDMACADLVKAAPAAAGSVINKDGKDDLTGKDKFMHLHPNTDWRVGLEHAEKIGLGATQYELIIV